MTEIVLIADDRERAVIRYLEQLCCTKTDRLTTGDYAFVGEDDSVLMVVERKSLSDLAASIKDGRMDNHDKLMEAQRKSGCVVMYLIEGPAYPSLDKKFGGLPFKCLQGKLDNLMLRDDIRIMWTRDEEHTAKRLAGLKTTICSLVKKSRFRVRVGSTEPASDQEGSEALTPISAEQPVLETGTMCADDVVKSKIPPKPLDYQQARMLCSIPGVSMATAKLLLSKCHLADLLSNSMNQVEMSDLTYESGFRIGDKRSSGVSRKIRTLSSNVDMCRKMLTCIDSVSSDSAQLILRRVDMEKIIQGDLVDGEIADIRRSNGRKLGLCLENKVKRAFRTLVCE